MENLEQAATLKEDEDKGITDDSVPDVTETQNGPESTAESAQDIEVLEEKEVIEKVEENGQVANTEPPQLDSESDNQDNGVIEVRVGHLY